MDANSVVFSGLGVVSPLGESCGFADVPDSDSYFRGLLTGASGLHAAPLSKFGTGEPFANAVGLVNGVDTKRIGKLIPEARKALRDAGRPAQLAVLAAHHALKDSGLLDNVLADPYRASVTLGGDGWSLPIEDWQKVLARTFSSNLEPGGEFWEATKYCISDLPPLSQLTVMTGAASAYVGSIFGWKGQRSTCSPACAAALESLFNGDRNLRENRVDYALVGASDSKLDPGTFGAFNRLGALSRRSCAPENACAPCALERDGLVLAEGAGIFVLERFADADRRGAPVYARILGFGCASGSSLIATDSEAVTAAIREACRDARVDVSDIDLIVAHATATPEGDKAEVAAIRAAFGSHADKPWVYNPKGAVGHQIVAAGAFGLAPALLALSRGVIPPNLNLKNPDPECKLNHTLETVEQRINTALVLAIGFGGSIVATILGGV